MAALDMVRRAELAELRVRMNTAKGAAAYVSLAILGNPPKLTASCSDEELEALARAAGVDAEVLAAMGREEKAAVVEARRGPARAGRGGLRGAAPKKREEEPTSTSDGPNQVLTSPLSLIHI